MKIAVDAMGGDLAPQAIVEGVIQASSELPSEARIVLIGRENVIWEIFNQHSFTPTNVDVVHAEDVIEMGEHPTKALSQKPNSSIGVGFKLLKEKEVDIFCSAGNTGAMHVGALFSIKAIEGILRPAIAGLVPQVGGGYAVMLDIGANADCKPEVLSQFGEIGSIFAQHTFQLDKPRVALMNIGEEEQKGSLTSQATYPLLKQNKRINFIGNIEGKDLFTNKADVIVTDGFTGNILFKLGESLYEISKKRGFQDDFIDQTNYESIGGSPIIGVNGNVMIAHGVSTPLAIKNMVDWAYKQVKSKAYLHIAQALS
ncbi:MAG: phosphate acyltransferase PlsX [Dyadobacter sp. 50-39]|uniref:phosphate acyltransferase PlsX n=1 Tax=Dyadobacter sp. 50-39 TaxID=1895756 RepID=UPI0009644D8C|nr:phosphate acyltransferase PlsX [Dyadobacter sp. 50-39]OJV21291.1 MAG: phosphate acyltransferase PlsX [Dyadobacter sp. 50-39]